MNPFIPSEVEGPFVNSLTRLKSDARRAEELAKANMILLTKLDGHTIAVNDALIVFAESTPDTVVTMSSGQRLLVREPLAELMERVLAFRRSTGVQHG